MPDCFNLADVFRMIGLHKFKIITVVVLSLIIASITLLLVPKYYKATAIVLPSNPEMADKERAAYNNLQRLYSYFGNNDDLDLWYGMAKLDTLYFRLTDSFNLANYYALNEMNASVNRFMAKQLLKKNIEFKKNENNQLEISVWDKSNIQATAIANAAVLFLKQGEESLWLNNYEKTYNANKNQIANLQQQLSLLSKQTNTNATAQQITEQTYLQHLAQYQKNLSDLQLVIQNVAPELYVVQYATPAVKPDKPKPILVLIAVACISLVIATSGVLLYSRNKGE
jgi:LPS O-antigen subunit length determinant protein (WzzB/FepE family)